MRFGQFVLDGTRGTLLENGVPVAIGARAVTLLEALLEAKGGVVTRSALMEAAWPNAVVDDSNLTVQMAALRKALGSSSDGYEWIATVPRVGYRFVGSFGPDEEDIDNVPVVTAPETFGRKPTIAVLPFRNLSSDPEQDYFVDGLSEDLITDLSKVPGLVVIARNSSFAYKGKSVDVRTVADQLAVRYVVEGSVRRAGNRLRINAGLTDAVENTPLWADRFDRELTDIFVLQDEVVGKIMNALAGALPSVHRIRRRKSTTLEAYELFARGRAMMMQSTDSNRAARPLLEQTTEIDPSFADAFAWLAMSHFSASTMWGESADHELAITYAKRAVALDADSAEAFMILGYIHMYRGQLSESATEFATALRINPNLADAWALLSDLMVFEGRAAEGIRCVEHAFRLNPNPPRVYYWTMGFAAYAARRYDLAIEMLRHEATYRTGSQRILAASFAQLGQVKEAEAEAQEFLAANPGFRVQEWADAHPFRYPVDRQHFVDGYVKAGLPK